jgi:N-acyl-D-amino-acid deacylase
MIQRRVGRTLFSAAILAILLASSAPRVGGAPAPGEKREGAIPMTGTRVPELAIFDRTVRGLMAKWQVPGGSLALMKDGRLILSRGYGWADREARERVEPDSLFRIASLSKSLTAAAILRLVEEGRLKLETQAFPLLALAPPPGATVDPRLDRITIQNLLQHTGGWDPEQSFDPMFQSREIARAMGVPTPANAEAIVRYMLGKPLQTAPGTHYAYSNFGYCVLGRIIEKVTGGRYEAYVQSHVLRPAGVTRMRLGRTLLADRAPGEVRYYGFPGIGLAASVFPTGPAQVPWPYGGWSIEAMDSHGGWLASAPDMARFVRAVDGRSGPPRVLEPASTERLIAHPASPVWKAGDATWCGMGWQVRPTNGDANWWHMGSLDGTTTLMVRAYNGLTWVAFFNTRPKDSDGFGGELDTAMWQAVAGVKRWPGVPGRGGA